MRRVVILVLVCAVSACGDPPPGHYDTATNKAGQELRSALHAIIRNHRIIPYSSSAFDTSDALKVLDEDPTNASNVRLIYAQRSEPKTNFPAVWNREHLWPNSYGLDGTGPEYSDLHNLRPEDENVNSARGNEYYDSSSTNDPGYRLPAHAEAPLCSSDSDSWEPPTEVKGDIARALFYMDVRYEGDGGEPDLVLTDQTDSIRSTNEFMGRLTTLLHWHYADPVDDAERLRNDLIYDLYQGNRNPFVDHPEWVGAVFLPAITISRFPGGIRLAWPDVYPSAVMQFSITGSRWADVTAETGPLPEGQWGLDIGIPVAAGIIRLRLE
jgi:endonuclease I